MLCTYLGLCLIIVASPITTASAGSAWDWLSGTASSKNDQHQHHQQQQQQQQQYRPLLRLVKPNRLASSTEGSECVDANRELFDTFVSQYNRTFENSADKMERLNLFINTIRRVILLNRVLQNEVTNITNYDAKPPIRNYYYISPVQEFQQQVFLSSWYADINDCELGLIKYIMFDLFYLIDTNRLAMAYQLATDNSENLPMMSSEGFHQLAEILIVRLFDRFRGDEKMQQLFQWPQYIKKLASFAYNRLQASQPNYKAKLSLMSFAYPSYFKDLKYSLHAINRTNDNLRSNEEHKTFMSQHDRRYSGLQERNKRLIIFRQRATQLGLLTSDYSWPENVTIQREWLQVRQNNDLFSLGNRDATNGGHSQRLRYREQNKPQQDALTFSDHQIKYPSLTETEESGSSSNNNNNNRLPSMLTNPDSIRYSQFSDLTDAEFVAFLTNDFSPLENSRESSAFVERNFPIRPLDETFRDELANELLARRTLDSPWRSAAFHRQQQQQQQQQDSHRFRVQQELQKESYALARLVVDELIGDIGLPIGSPSVATISESEHLAMFNKISLTTSKVYAGPSRMPFGSSTSVRRDETGLSEEKLRRFEQFKLNHGRFKAWHIKEGWQRLNDAQQVAMLRLADLSWPEIKLTLTKLCCLEQNELQSLASENATIHYLVTNSFICQPLQVDGVSNPMGREQFRYQLARLQATTDANNNNPSDGSQLNAVESSEMLALELYYYYSVHFNKHQNDARVFEDRLSVFKYNIEKLKRLSCLRRLTLVGSLQLKKADTINTVDVTDPRRAYTDDLNLDRFRYFEVPNLNKSPPTQSPSPSPVSDSGDSSSLGFERLRADSGAFSKLLLDDGPTKMLNNQRFAQESYANLLKSTLSIPSLNDIYRSNNVWRIYELIGERYRYCVRESRHEELSSRELASQQCLSSGPLSDLSSSPSWVGMERDNQQAARMKLLQKDKCAFYWLGLEAWIEGLLSQDSVSRELITNAKC